MRRTSLDQGRGEPWNDTYDAGQEPRSTACMLAGGCLLYSVMRGRVRRRTGAIVLLIELGAPCIVGGADCGSQEVPATEGGMARRRFGRSLRAMDCAVSLAAAMASR